MGLFGKKKTAEVKPAEEIKKEVIQPANETVKAVEPHAEDVAQEVAANKAAANDESTIKASTEDGAVKSPASIDGATPASSGDGGFSRALDYVKNAVRLLGLPSCEVSAREDATSFTVSVSGDANGLLIGHRGEALDALQTLATLAAGKLEDKKRIVVDVEGYRLRRLESLEKLARKIAREVAESGRAEELEPMNSADRRAIHSALSDDKTVTSESHGVDPFRYIVIAPVGAAPFDPYDHAAKSDFRRGGAGKTRSFGAKSRKF